MTFEEWYRQNKHLIQFNHDQARLVWDAAINSIKWPTKPVAVLLRKPNDPNSSPA